MFDCKRHSQTENSSSSKRVAYHSLDTFTSIVYCMVSEEILTAITLPSYRQLDNSHLSEKKHERTEVTSNCFGGEAKSAVSFDY